MYRIGDLSLVEPAVSALDPDKVIIVTDSTVWPLLGPVYRQVPALAEAPVAMVKAGEANKNFESLASVIEVMTRSGATRRSLAVNIGGGMVTDLGGFAAAVFKRGIRFINIPTTLLGAVDASIGGKTGIDFLGFKNEVGAFADPVVTLVRTENLLTLPRTELLSGYAEMLKTGYIASEALLKQFDPERDLSHPESLGELIGSCLAFKEEVTTEDPTERGRRRILNFGHTAGHAFESMMLRRGAPVPHGCAVAHGMLVALLLSHMVRSLPASCAQQYAREVLVPHYGVIPLGCRDYPGLLSLMSHDKKNLRAGEISFVLLDAPGKPVWQPVEPKLIEAALDIYRDLTDR